MVKKITRSLVLPLMLILMITVCLCLTSCDSNEHTHTFAEDWSSNETHHYHLATCEHSEEKSNYEEHSFVNHVCGVCGKIDEATLYSTLYNIVPRNLEDIKDNTTLTDTYKATTTVLSLDFTNSNRTEEQQQQMRSSMSVPIVVDEKTTYAYKDADSGEAYRLTYIKEGENYVPDPDTTPIYYFKSGDKYYKFIKAKVTADYVSKGHAQYSILEATNDMLSFLIEAPENYSEFAEYILNGMAEWGTILTPEDIKTSWKIEGNQYKFLITISSTSNELFEDNIEITFTENAITKFIVKSKDTYNTNKADPEGDGYTIVNTSESYQSIIEFSEGFEPVTYELPSLENVGNCYTRRYVFINGAEYDNLRNDYTIGFEPYLDIFPNATFYLDKECTIEVTGPITSKSYEDIFVYTKIDKIPEGYAEVIYSYLSADYPSINYLEDGEEIWVSPDETAYVYVDGSETPIVITNNDTPLTVEEGHKYYIEIKHNN